MNATSVFPVPKENSQHSRAVLMCAKENARQLGQPEVTGLHLLIAVIRDCRGFLGKELRKRPSLVADMEHAAHAPLTLHSQSPCGDIVWSEELRRVNGLAFQEMALSRHKEVKVKHLSIGLLTFSPSPVSALLDEFGFNRASLVNNLRHQLMCPAEIVCADNSQPLLM